MSDVIGAYQFALGVALFSVPENDRFSGALTDGFELSKAILNPLP